MTSMISTLDKLVYCLRRSYLDYEHVLGNGVAGFEISDGDQGFAEFASARLFRGSDRFEGLPECAFDFPDAVDELFEFFRVEAGRVIAALPAFVQCHVSFQDLQ